MIKRNLLKSIFGMSASSLVLPSKWVKPVMSSVLIPVHAQASPIPNPNPKISISEAQCSNTESSFLVGTIISMSAQISSIGIPLDDVNWVIKKNNQSLNSGVGGNAFANYAPTREDIGNLRLEIEASFGGLFVQAALCEGQVSSAPPLNNSPPRIKNLVLEFNTPDRTSATLMPGSSITIDLEFEDRDSDINQLDWAVLLIGPNGGRSTAVMRGQFVTQVITIETLAPSGTYEIVIEADDNSGQSNAIIFERVFTGSI